MQVQSLALAGFGSFMSRCELDLSEVDVCAVTGQNGAGKSTIFDALLWCLLGDTPGRQAGTIVNETARSARVEAVILTETGEHTIRRSRSASGSVTAELVAPGGAQVTGATPVSKHVAGLLGCDASLLTLTAFARQGDAGRFGNMDPSGRREALARALLQDAYSAPAKTVHELQEDALPAAAKAEAKLEGLEDEAADLDDATAQHSAAVAAAEKADRAYSAALDKRQEAAAGIERLAAGHAAHNQHDQLGRKLAEAQERSEHAKRAANAAAAALDDAKNADLLSGDDTDAVRKSVEAAEEAEADSADALNLASVAAAEARAAAEGAEERIHMLQRGQGECWVCGSVIEDGGELIIADLEKTLHAQSTAEQAVKSAERAHSRDKSKVAAAREALEQARDLTEERAVKLVKLTSRLEQARASVEETAKALSHLQAEYAQSKSLLPDLDELAAVIGDLPDIDQVKVAHEAAQRDLGSSRQRLDQARAANDRLPEMRKAHDAAVDKSRGLGLLSKALAPAGVPHLALSLWADHLAAAANTALQHLGALQVRFVMSDPEKSRPPLGLEARDPAYGWRPYSTFSGGERMRIDIALRIGLTAVCGIKSKTMVLDEGWGALDPLAAAKMAHLLTGLVESGQLRCFFTITHVEAAAAEFKHRIEVTNGMGGSSARLLKA